MDDDVNACPCMRLIFTFCLGFGEDVLGLRTKNDIFKLHRSAHIKRDTRVTRVT